MIEGRLYTWRSPHTGEEMRLIRYGSGGSPLIYIPSSGGDHEEFACYGMAGACAPWIQSGRVQLFAVDGFGPRTLFNDAICGRERMRSYARFERYASLELLPWVRRRAPHGPLGVVGASYGAFVAANLLFKRYDVVELACGLGGVYGLWHRLDGHHDDEVYFHTPLEYLPRLEDARILEALRQTRGLTLFGGEQDVWLHSTRRLAQVMQEKGLPHRTEIWPAPADHHQRWWTGQLCRFLEQAY